MSSSSQEDIYAYYRMVDPYAEGAAGARQLKRRLYTAAATAVAVVVCVVIAFVAWSELRPPNIESYADIPITIIGLTEEDFQINAQELSQMECVAKDISGQGQAIDGKENSVYVNAYGPLFSTFLEAYGHEASDFRRVIISCNDGFVVVLTKEMLEDDGIIMSIAMGKDALEPWQQPMRFVIPSEQSGNWAYGVESIEFNR